MILYKYYPLNENSFRSLAVGALWCHHPSEMNDPLECLLGYPDDTGKQEIEAFLSALDTINPSLFRSLRRAYDQGTTTFFEAARDHLIRKFAFCSLSERSDNLLMWSHYANQHRGCVIGLRFPDDLSGHLLPVQYADTAEPLPWGALLTVLDKANDNTTAGHAVISRILRNLSRKAVCWDYELEWRIWRNGPQIFCL